VTFSDLRAQISTLQTRNFDLVDQVTSLKRENVDLFGQIRALRVGKSAE
jgi:hypothetical protein